MEYISTEVRSFVLPDSYTRIQITPFVKKINWDLKWRSLEVRKCYLHNERNLSIFLQYSESNCNYECKINETITMCGCIFFEAACEYLILFLPFTCTKRNNCFFFFLSFQLDLTNGVKICGPGKKECVQRAIRNLLICTILTFINYTGCISEYSPNIHIFF